MLRLPTSRSWTERSAENFTVSFVRVMVWLIYGGIIHKKYVVINVHHKTVLVSNFFSGDEIEFPYSFLSSPCRMESTGKIDIHTHM